MLLTACSRRSLHAVPSRVPCLPCPPVLAFLAGSRWWFLSLGSGCLRLSLPAWPSLVWGREARTDLASAEPRRRRARAQAQALSFAGSGPLLTWAAGARALPGWWGPIGKDFLCDLTSLLVTSSPLPPPFVAELRGQLCSPALLLLSMAEAFPALGTGGAATRPSALLSSPLLCALLPGPALRQLSLQPLPLPSDPNPHCHSWGEDLLPHVTRSQSHRLPRHGSRWVLPVKAYHPRRVVSRDVLSSDRTWSLNVSVPASILPSSIPVLPLSREKYPVVVPGV